LVISQRLIVFTARLLYNDAPNQENLLLEVLVSERVKSSADVIALESKRKTIRLRDLLRDEDVADFFRFVNDEGMREQALKRIEERIEKMNQ